MAREKLRISRIARRKKKEREFRLGIIGETGRKYGSRSIAGIDDLRRSSPAGLAKAKDEIYRALMRFKLIGRKFIRRS